MGLALCLLGVGGCQYGYQLTATAPRSLLGGTALSLRNAWLLESGARLQATVTNDGKRPIAIDYREWAVRSPEGRSFPPDTQKCCAEPTVLEPGQSQDICLEFPVSGTNPMEWAGAEIVVGGVKEMPDGNVQVAGTLPLARAGIRARYDQR